MIPFLYKHLKTGGIYEVISEGFNERDLTPIVVYRSKSTGEVFVRPTTEFYDGRFKAVSPSEINWDPMRDIEEFHQKFGLPYAGKPRDLGEELTDFRLKFMEEELHEYKIAVNGLRAHLAFNDLDDAEVTHRLEHALDGLVDLVYVALGTAYLHGFDFREAWRRVHKANMRKVRAVREEDSRRGSTFDVVKPPGWEPPKLTDLVEDHAHRDLGDG